MMLRARRTRFCRLASLIAIPAALLASPEASGDEWLDRLNDLAAPAPGEQDGTKLLFDAVAGMDDDPDELTTYERAREIIPGMNGWDELSAWAGAPAQQKVIVAIATITERKDRYILGLGYTDEGVASRWIDEGLYVEQSEDGLLLNATPLYLSKIEQVFALQWIEMVRLIEAGDTSGAVDVMERSVRFSRVLMERPTSEEVFFAKDMMLRTLEKILDTCRNFKGEFSASEFADLNRRFEERRLLMDRLQLPMGDKEIAGQIVAMGIEERRSAEGTRLSSLMSKLSGDTNARPLERFSRAAHWTTIAEHHADWFDTTDQLDNLFGDWNARWGLPDLKDPMLSRLTDYQKMDKRRFLILEEIVAGYEQMFVDRLQLYTAMHGAKSAIAVLGFEARSDRFPPELPAVQPQFIKKLDADPYSILSAYRNTTRTDIAYTRWQKHESFHYFVPIRDQDFDRREEPGPYEVELQFESGAGAGAMMAGPGAIGSGGGDEFQAAMFEGMMQGFGSVQEESIGSLEEDVPEWISRIDPDDAERRLGAFIDLETLDIDYDGLRSELTDIVTEAMEDGVDPADFDDIFNQMINDGFTPDTYRTQMEQMLAFAGSDEGVSEANATVTQMLGIDMDAAMEGIVDFVDGLMNVPSVKNAFAAVSAGGTITEDKARSVVLDSIDYAVREDAAGPLVDVAKGFMSGPMGQMMMAQIGGGGSSLFASLDDSTFILYSVGPDTNDDDAKRCVTIDIDPKAEGTDVLVYPPALSLRRELGMIK